MSVYSKVVWSEGLFLRPQHFQQQDRYFERYVETRCQSLVPHSWGFTELEVERDLLSIGKFGLRRAAGVFPDGTPFRMPDDDPLPAPIDIGAEVHDQVLYLALPLRRAGAGDGARRARAERQARVLYLARRLRRAGAADVDRSAGADGLVRHEVREVETSDGSSTSGDSAVLEVGALRTRLLLASEVTQAYACVPLTQVVECRTDKHVLLDDTFIPTVLDVRASRRLSTYMPELLGLLHQRGDALGGRVTASGRGASAEIAEFLM